MQLQNRVWYQFRAPEWFGYDPVTRRYEERFRQLDWGQVPEVDEAVPRRGRLPHPQAAYLKAYLVMSEEKLEYTTQLHRYLCDHPALVWLVGFRLVPDEDSVYGFDVAASLPSARHLRRVLANLDQGVVDNLLRQTVHRLQQVLPHLGQEVALDVKHIYAHVRENNPREEVPDRYNRQRQPKGDPDCRLGLKRAYNQQGRAARRTVRKEWIWGYGTGLAVAQTPNKDAVVVAEYTLPFNQPDITYALPLLHRAMLNLGFAPPNLTADAAFDAWYVYQWCAELKGMAAIALNTRRAAIVLGANNRPLCACNGQEMLPFETWIEDTYRVGRFRCCACQAVRKMNIELGNLMRWGLDRHSTAYQTLYQQRTTTERINSQAAALGIDRPCQRRQQPIARRNTLIYVTINLRALNRHHQRNRDSPLSTLAA